MKSNIICMLGALPFGICGYYWNSAIMLYVCLIGILFHSMPHNNFLHLLDLSSNTFFSIKASLQNRQIFILFILSSIIFCLNSYIYIPKNKLDFYCNLRHVFFTQFLGLYGYYLIYKQDTCNSFFFNCDSIKLK